MLKPEAILDMEPNGRTSQEILSERQVRVQLLPGVEIQRIAA